MNAFEKFIESGEIQLDGGVINYSRPYCGSVPLAQFLLAQDNSVPVIVTMRQYAAALYNGEEIGSRGRWITLAALLKRNPFFGPLIDWAVIDDHALFVESVFTAMQRRMFGGSR